MKKLPFALLTLLMSACAVATPTPSATPLPMVTSTAQGGNTVTAAITPTGQSSATPINIPTHTQQPPDLFETQVAAFPIQCIKIEGSSFSPNERWLAVSCRGEGKTINLQIINKAGKDWQLKFTDYVGENASGELRAEHWSNDGEYLYFSLVLGLSGGGDPCLLRFGTPSLYRLKLNDGSVATILPESSFFAFSPTDRRLAYQSDGDLIIRDLQTGDELHIRESRLIDHPLWSKDGKVLIYATCNSNLEGDSEEIKKSAIRAFSIVSNSTSTIIEKEKMFLYITNLDENGVITIGSNDESYKFYTETYFDLNTKQWITPTPTP